MHRARRRLASVGVVRPGGGEDRDDVLGERLGDAVEHRRVGAVTAGDVRDGRILDRHPAFAKGRPRGVGGWWLGIVSAVRFPSGSIRRGGGAGETRRGRVRGAAWDSPDVTEALEEILRRVLQPRHSERRRDGSE